MPPALNDDTFGRPACPRAGLSRRAQYDSLHFFRCCHCHPSPLLVYCPYLSCSVRLNFFWKGRETWLDALSIFRFSFCLYFCAGSGEWVMSVCLSVCVCCFLTIECRNPTLRAPSPLLFWVCFFFLWPVFFLLLMSSALPFHHKLEIRSWHRVDSGTWIRTVWGIYFIQQVREWVVCVFWLSLRSRRYCCFRFQNPGRPHISLERFDCCYWFFFILEHWGEGVCVT